MSNITRNFVGRDEEDEEDIDDDDAVAAEAEAGNGAGVGTLPDVASTAAASALYADHAGGGGRGADEGGNDTDGNNDDGGGGTAAALDEEEDEEYDLPQDERVRARSCQLLSEVLRIVPARINELSRVLGEHFPHKTVEIRVQASYIAGLFAFAELHPLQLCGIIIPLVLQHLIQIDVQIDDSVLDDAAAAGSDGLRGEGGETSDYEYVVHILRSILYSDVFSRACVASFPCVRSVF